MFSAPETDPAAGPPNVDRASSCSDAVEVAGVDEFGVAVQQLGDLEFVGRFTHVTCPFTTGRPGSLATSSGDGGAPAATRCAANDAIIAPLSVHSRGRGIRSVNPFAAQRSSASSRSREFAATPPAISSVDTPSSVAARTAFIVSTSATASWNPAATSACGAAGLLLDVARDGGLEPGEAERVRVVARPGHAAGEHDRVAVALAGQVVEHLAAGIAEAEQPRDLVVGLARGVVDGAAELVDRFGQRPHVQQVGVAAGDQQADAFRQRAVVVDVGGEVPAEVVDRVERHLPGDRIGLGRGHSHQQGACQPGPDGGRDDVRLGDARRVQCAAHGGPQRLQMRPRRDLGHHAAEPGVFVDAGGHLVGQQCHGAVGRQLGDADSGFVAGTFDGKDGRHVGPPRAGRCIV